MSEHLSAGRYCVLCPRGGAGITALFGSLGVSFGRGSNPTKSTHQRIDDLIKSASKTSSTPTKKEDTHEEEEEEDAPRDRLVDTGGQLGVGSWNSSPHTWHFGHASAAVVHFGLFEVVGGINRVQPSVFYDEGENFFCVFQGYLSNLEELIDRYFDVSPDSRSSSPTAVIMPKKTPGEKAAELVYSMFQQVDDPLVLLSELQGQYAFALVDGDRKQVFAARDSSGKENLYFEIDEDGGLTISNERLRVRSSDGMGLVAWEELLPGHYLSGKPVKVHQFALTPAQLTEREYNDALDDAWDDDNPSHHSKRSFSDSDDFVP